MEKADTNIQSLNFPDLLLYYLWGSTLMLNGFLEPNPSQVREHGCCLGSLVFLCSYSHPSLAKRSHHCSPIPELPVNASVVNHLHPVVFNVFICTSFFLYCCVVFHCILDSVCDSALFLTSIWKISTFLAIMNGFLCFFFGP